MSRASTMGKRRGGRRAEADQDGWLVAYADLITLLFILFCLLLSISSVNRSKFEAISDQFNHHESNLVSLQHRLDAQIRADGMERKVQTDLTSEGLQVAFNEHVLFGSAEAKLSSSGEALLGRFAHVLVSNAREYQIVIEGHTDEQPIHTPDFPSNWNLSAARAVNVLEHLAAVGVDEKKMTVRAYAANRPLKAQPGQSRETERARNRRVALLIY